MPKRPRSSGIRCRYNVEITREEYRERDANACMPAWSSLTLLSVSLAFSSPQRRAMKGEEAKEELARLKKKEKKLQAILNSKPGAGLHKLSAGQCVTQKAIDKLGGGWFWSGDNTLVVVI